MGNQVVSVKSLSTYILICILNISDKESHDLSLKTFKFNISFIVSNQGGWGVVN